LPQALCPGCHQTAPGYNQSPTPRRFEFIGDQGSRALSWKETAEEFHTSWNRVHDAVAYLVTWGWSIASGVAKLRQNASSGVCLRIPSSEKQIPQVNQKPEKSDQ